MKTNKDSLKASMDRRLSFLDNAPSCRAAVQYRIAQEEEPVMKKKISVGFVFAMVLVLLSMAALATTLLLSPKATAARTADQALEKEYGITARMMTFFSRGEEEAENGAVQVTYTGAGGMEYVLGTYTVLVKDGKAEITWSHSGEDTSGGYEAEAWGAEQLAQMIEDSREAASKQAYMDKALAIAEAHGITEDDTPSEAAVNNYEQRNLDKTAAMQARKLSEEEMIQIGRDFIISNYSLNEEQAARMELYTQSFQPDENSNGNDWYEMIDGKPCFQVEFLLYQLYTTTQLESDEPLVFQDGDGYYNVYVNVETGEIETYEYNSALAGVG